MLLLRHKFGCNQLTRKRIEIVTQNPIYCIYGTRGVHFQPPLTSSFPRKKILLTVMIILIKTVAIIKIIRAKNNHN